MTTYIPHLPTLPSDHFETCELAFRSFAAVKQKHGGLLFVEPTVAYVDSLCLMGAVMRSFGLCDLTAVKGAIYERTEFRDFVLALGRQLLSYADDFSIKRVNSGEMRPINVRMYMNSVISGLYNWSDEVDRHVSEAWEVLVDVELVLGYRSEPCEREW